MERTHSILTRLRWRIMAAAGAHVLFRRLNRSRALIVMYHGVVPNGRPYYYWGQLAESKFRWQLEYLKRHYTVLPLPEVVAGLAGDRPLPPNAAAITFDDGYANNAAIAWPHLRDLGLPATIFLVTGMIGTRRLLWPDEVFVRIWRAMPRLLDLRHQRLGLFNLETARHRARSYETLIGALKKLPADRKDRLLDELKRLLPSNRAIPDFSSDFLPMSWEEVERLAESGLVQFGAHSISHEILTRIPRDEAHRQIAESCRELRRRLPGMPLTFAYPNGGPDDFDSFLQDVLRDEGALCGLTTVEGLNERGADPFALQRVSVGADACSYRFPLRSSGAVPWLKSKLSFAGKDADSPQASPMPPTDLVRMSPLVDENADSLESVAEEQFAR